MSTYEKPMVMVNEELAEGVYAASGRSANCWSISASTTGNIVGSGREVHISGTHTNPGHHNAAPIVSVSFNQTISGVTSTSGWSCSAGGTTVTVSHNIGTSNGSENWGGNIVVTCTDPATLSVTGVTWDCGGAH